MKTSLTLVLSAFVTIAMFGCADPTDDESLLGDDRRAETATNTNNNDNNNEPADPCAARPSGVGTSPSIELQGVGTSPSSLGGDSKDSIESASQSRCANR